MILKFVEGVSSKDTSHVVKAAVDLSIFSQLLFFKIAAKVKKALPLPCLPYICINILLKPRKPYSKVECNTLFHNFKQCGHHILFNLKS